MLRFKAEARQGSLDYLRRQTERALANGVVSAVGPGTSGGAGRARASLLRNFPAAMVMAGATNLVGLSHGEQKYLGQCRLNGRALAFDLWWPHLGVAIDFQAKPDEEIQTKRDWAVERFVAYYAPADLDEEGRDRIRILMLNRQAYARGEYVELDDSGLS